MLTLFYASSTFMRSWRIKNVCNKITEQLEQRSSITFYALSALTDDGYDAALATSDLCVNRSAAKVTEILWLHGNRRGCSLRPLQTLQVKPWISFPEDAPANSVNFLPFAHSQTPEKLLQRLDSSKNVLYLLLETETQPCHKEKWDVDIVKLEDYGKLIAWKIDSHLAVLIETDVEHFTKLLISTFLQNCFLINDRLPLIRIESVNYEGEPQPFEMLANHLRKSTRTTVKLNDEEWQKHLDGLRALSVLAHQATEFEHNKNKTEGKTGIVTPDLIPSEKNKESDTASEKESNIEAKTVTVNGTESTTKTADIKSPNKSGSSQVKIPPKVVVQSPTSTAEVTIPKPLPITTTTAVGKMKAKPTAIKKPGDISTDGRFKTTKVSSESPEKDSVKKSQTSQPTTPSVVSPVPTAVSPVPPAVSPEPIVVFSEPTVMLPEPTVMLPEPTVMLPEPTVMLPELTVASLEPTVVPPESTVVSPEPTVVSLEPTVVSPLPPVVSPDTKLQKSFIETNIKPSELEKIAAAVVQKEKSPVNAATSATFIDKQKTSQLLATKPSTSTSVAAKPDTSISVNKDNAQRPNLIRHKDSLVESKPLNILVYSDIASARDSVMVTLKDILEKDTYTIYPMTPQQVEQKFWLDSTALLVVCGAVPTNIGEIFVDYFLHGGKVLSLCSDILHFILPNYRTAEVREHELVQFSYDKWQKVKMMHHIFCYQPSPVKKNFSTDSEDSAQTLAKKPALVCPRSIELKDLHGELHNLDVKVLGTEETWRTPSLLLADSLKSHGTAVFSQVHLETNPNEFEADEIKYAILKQNEKIRLEIFADLLNKHLQVKTKQANSAVDTTAKCVYQNAYFLGHHESKFELLKKLKKETGKENMIVTPKLTLNFCGKDEKPPAANTNVLPVLIHSCPEDFSTVDYFDNLKTKYIGRLVIYAPVISSSMNVITELELTPGIAVLPRQQFEGMGRSNNQWLSPLGCAMFSIQLHIPLESELGTRIPLIQHIIGTAMVNALKSHPIYKVFNIGIKWPNDIYVNGTTKIGGLLVRTTILDTNAIVNIGGGINLDNSKPTTCINDMISEYNKQHHQNLPKLKYDEFIALIFNEIERLVEQVQKGDIDEFYSLYFNLWLHNDQTVTICDKDGKKKEAKIIGIDDNGYLDVKITLSGAIESVQPDGNSFDMLKGLIVPKYH